MAQLVTFLNRNQELLAEQTATIQLLRIEAHALPVIIEAFDQIASASTEHKNCSP